MKILIAGMMGAGTLEAKIVPLSRVQSVEKIYFLRKMPIRKIPKVQYLQLPAICSLSVFHIILTPLLLIYHTWRLRPDLIIGYHVIPYGFFVAVCGRLCNVPYIIAQTGAYIQNYSRYPLFKQVLGWAFSGALVNLCPGRNSLKYWSKMYSDISRKFRVLHSTIDTNRFREPELRKPTYDFLYLGRLHAVKNISFIINSVFILNSKYRLNTRLQIVGDGPELENLISQVNELELKDNVIFQGFQQDQVPYIQDSRFIVMASESEGLPTSMMQSMACGVIPITNIVNNIGDIVSEGVTGFVFHDSSHDDMPLVMYNALTMNSNTIQAMRLNCRDEIVNNHSYEASISKWEFILSKYIET